MRRPSDAAQRRSSVAPALAGALAAAILSVALGYGLQFAGAGAAAVAFRSFLARGGWLWLPCFGAAIALLLTLSRPLHARARWRNAVIAVALLLTPLLLRPAMPGEEPRPGAKRLASDPAARLAILRWAYQGPKEIAGIVPYARDPDPITRAVAVQALGINRIVSDVEHAGSDRPSHYATSPVRSQLRAALEAALGDSDERVRSEAARALWRAPVTFGDHPAAGETLVAVLDRRSRMARARPAALDGPSWNAFNAERARSTPALRAAIERWIAAGPDSADRRRAYRSGALGRERTTLR